MSRLIRTARIHAIEAFIAFLEWLRPAISHALYALHRHRHSLLMKHFAAENEESAT